MADDPKEHIATPGDWYWGRQCPLCNEMALHTNDPMRGQGNIKITSETPRSARVTARCLRGHTSTFPPEDLVRFQWWPKIYVHMPMYCETCHKFYPSPVWMSGNNVGVRIENVVSNCPQGHRTQILDGTYTFRDGILSLGGMTEETREKIKSILSDAVAGTTEPEAALDAIGELAPSLKPVLKLTKNPNLLLYLALLLWFVVEMTKALRPEDKGRPGLTTINIENKPIIVNQISVDERVSPKSQFTPRDRNIGSSNGKHSKRKERRLRGKAKEHVRRQS